MQYLIRTLTDSTGTPFTHVTKARSNETFQVVEAESREEAERKASDKIQCPRCESWNTEHEYVYVNSQPVYFQFICDDCDSSLGKYIKKDSE